MRKQFDIKYRPQIESGEYKVETRDGRPVRILCWDRTAKEDQPKDLKLCVLVPENGGEAVYYYYPDGTKWVKDACFDLFIVTPEEELNPFENRLCEILYSAINYQIHSTVGEIIEDAKKLAPELLALAREQFIKDGYVIEKKAFHDAVEKVDPEVMKEVSENIDAINEALRLEYEKGRADVLKDLPRWRTIEEATTKRTDENDCVTTETMLVKGWMNRNDYRIVGPECIVNRKMLCVPVVELSKLPGFKEDEK